MQNLLDNLKALLQKDERLVSEGEILKNKVMELALKLDKGLIELLLSDEKMKEVFFTQVGKATIFDKDKFIKFVSNKQFLPDSYTAFKNKIGLIDEKGEFISEKKEVVLSWPYKDCVLEGGMTKEDQKRDEIFWNEILAPDEISRLLDPKVFTNAKRIDAKGEHKFDSFRTDENGDTKDNLIIKGNNLLALHSLKKRFAGKVKLIYIDPPYNTGGSLETFTYNNAFNHSTWMTFMKNRLEVAKELLTEDGFIVIAIDHNELFYLGALADEIFDRENRVGLVSVLSNPMGRQYAKFFSATNDYMLVYARNELKAQFNNVVISEERDKTFNMEDEKGKYKLNPFLHDHKKGSREIKPDNWYPIYVSRDLKDISLEKKQGYFELWPISDKGIERSWMTIKGTTQERINNKELIAKKDSDGKIRLYYKFREQERITTCWIDKKYNANHYGARLLEKITGKKGVSYPKSLYTIIDVIKIMAGKNDIVLDFFAGSGTTAHAVLELNKEDGGNRKFILVEQLDEHIAVCKERIQKVLQKEKNRR
jgi:adenine-specific DNA-methyltransferase